MRDIILIDDDFVILLS